MSAEELRHDPDVKKALESYDNPRGMPEKWILGYLGRNRLQLAIDVMRAFDENAKLRRTINRYKVINIALTSIITALAIEGLKLLIGVLR